MTKLAMPPQEGWFNCGLNLLSSQKTRFFNLHRFVVAKLTEIKIGLGGVSGPIHGGMRGVE